MQRLTPVQLRSLVIFSRRDFNGNDVTPLRDPSEMNPDARSDEGLAVPNAGFRGLPANNCRGRVTSRKWSRIIRRELSPRERPEAEAIGQSGWSRCRVNSRTADQVLEFCFGSGLLGRADFMKTRSTIKNRMPMNSPISAPAALRSHVRSVCRVFPSPRILARAVVGTLYALLAAAGLIWQVNGTVIWKEDFESNAAQVNWAPTRGNWIIGVPTNPNGPGKAHSGSRCAAIGLSQNYSPAISSSLSYFQTLNIPDKARNPKLRFWHWFAINNSAPYFGEIPDYGQVKVLLANGTEEAISPQYNATSDWAPAILDLSKYAGSAIQIEFYFFSNTENQAAGWFVDDVEITADDYPFMGFDSFECGWGNWATTRGNWQVGTPQNGPGKAWSGDQCAAVVLQGNYPTQVSSSLVSPSFLVPPASQNPRLRFMHWFSIDTSAPYFGEIPDYGQVKVLMPDGTEQPISPQFNGTSDWTPASVDLTKYAGTAVQIEFYFYSNTENQSSGWFIDDVELRTGDHAFLARESNGSELFAGTESFDNGWGDWAATRGNWQVGAPQNGPGKAWSGNFCAGIVLTGKYPAQVSSSLVSPPFVVPAATQSPRLRFMHWFSIDNSAPYFGEIADYGQVKVILPDGSEQTLSATYNGTSDWTPALLDLSKYAGKTIQVEFYFYSNTENQSSGWFIDDVQLLPPVGNHPPSFTAVPSQTASEGSTLTLKFQATDPDPGQAVAYSLDPDTAPTGATIDPVTGVFTWAPTSGQLSTNAYYVRVRATDNGQPTLSASYVLPILTSNAPHLLPSSDQGTFRIDIPDAVVGFDYNLESSSDLKTWQPTASFTLLARGEPKCYQTNQLSAPGQTFYRLQMKPSQP
jgi:hypothetical protein